MYLLRIDQLQKLIDFIESTKPLEASGLILAEDFSKNTILSFVETACDENTSISFRIRDKTIKEVKDSIQDSGLRICGCFHSHILGPARPSYYDWISTKTIGDLWLIYSVKFLELILYSWDGSAFHKERFCIVK